MFIYMFICPHAFRVRHFNSRSVISSVAGSGESRGSDIMPAVVSVVESIRGVMETVGTPTSAHKTEASSTRQQDADAVKR